MVIAFVYAKTTTVVVRVLVKGCHKKALTQITQSFAVKNLP